MTCASRAREDDQAKRLMSVPGIGTVCARWRSRHSRPRWRASGAAATSRLGWGLVPRQSSTGGKPKLGKISKMGQRDLRRLLITGAMGTVCWAVRRGAHEGPVAGPGCWRASVDTQNRPIVDG